jgi:hypothetical protein
MSKTSNRFVSQIDYCVTKHHITICEMSLLHRSANGGVAGSDIRVICKIFSKVDIRCISDHQATKVPLAVVGGDINSQKDLYIYLGNFTKDCYRILI